MHVNRPIRDLFTRKKAVRDRLPYFLYHKDTTFFDEKQIVLKLPQTNAQAKAASLQFNDFKVLEVRAVHAEAHERAHLVPSLQTGRAGIDVQKAQTAVVEHFQYM